MLVWGCSVLLPLGLLVVGLFLLPIAVAVLAAGDLFFGLAALFAYFYAAAWKTDLQASNSREAATATVLADVREEFAKSAADVKKLTAALEEETSGRAAAETNLAAANGMLEGERRARVEAEKSLRDALSKIDSANEAAEREKVRADGAERTADTARGESLALRQALKDESETTRRASFIPSINVVFSVAGFGILSDKTVFAHVFNNGPGVAHKVQVYAAQGGPLLAAAFAASIDVKRAVNVQVGKIPRGSTGARIQVRVEYASQFGPLPPVELYYQP